jgi:chromosome segregation ATPase
MKDKPIIFKEDVVQKLLSNGIVELVQRIFVRPLNDYETAFNELVIREHEVSEQIKLYERDSSEIDSSNQLGQEMISFRQVEHQQLQADLQGYQQEITVLQQAIEAADQDFAQLKSQLSEMYRSIQSAHQRLLGGTVNLTSAPKL